MADTNFNLTQAERQRFIDEELEIYNNTGTLESAADFGATFLRGGGQNLFGARIDNIRLRERQAELQKQLDLLDIFFGTIQGNKDGTDFGLAGRDFNNLADIDLPAESVLANDVALADDLREFKSKIDTFFLAGNRGETPLANAARVRGTEKPSLTGQPGTGTSFLREKFRGQVSGDTLGNIPLGVIPSIATQGIDKPESAVAKSARLQRQAGEAEVGKAREARLKKEQAADEARQQRAEDFNDRMAAMREQQAQRKAANRERFATDRDWETSLSL